MGASREVATWLGSKAATAALLGADCVNNRLETMMKEGGDDRGWSEPKSERLNENRHGSRNDGSTKRAMIMKVR